MRNKTIYQKVMETFTLERAARIFCCNVPVVLCAMLLITPELMAQESDSESKKVTRVFFLAGQSNMVGHGVVDLDDPKDYNSGKGTLVKLMQSPKKKQQFAHLKNKSGKWIVRDDAFIWFQTKDELKTGGVSIGFSGYEGSHHFGPEMQFGHVVGEAFDEPVLIIKTAWGGKSLYKDFRPPSSGGEVGPFYVRMLEQIATALDKSKEKFPSLKDTEMVLSGFVWQQGWNDMIDDAATGEYEKNLVNFISDIRKQFDTPELPFVFGELGNGGGNASEKMRRFRAAQAAVAKHDDPLVTFVETAEFARQPDDSPNKGHGHHWFGNAESYFLVGDALGHAMVRQVRGDANKPRVLILGDSISIGYTPFVQKEMAEEAFVIRPMRRNPKNKRMSHENCAGTDHGIKSVDRWLRLDGGDWDLIHYNFGLHDLKHVDGKTQRNSNKASDPLQSSPEEYEKQLREIVTKLKATRAKLICCTTTPVPEGCKPLRETTAPEVYNKIAKKIAAEFGAEVNDLYAFANPQLKKIQRSADVHFTREGSEVLAGKVTEVIRAALRELEKTQ